MTAQEIFQLLRERFGEKTILALYQTDTSDRRNPIVFDPPQIHVAGAQIAEVCRYLKEHEATRFEALMSLSGVDNGPVLSVIYHLHSMSHRHKIALRADTPRSDPHLPTVEKLWPVAAWHERETHDLFGIVFDGHSDLRPLILPEGWEGYPLRKDYKVQEYYRGMKVPY